MTIKKPGIDVLQATFGLPLPPFFDPVPDDFIRPMVDLVPVLTPGIDGNDRRTGLLTLARIWTTLASCEIHPKDQAPRLGARASPEDHRPVLAHARTAYLGEEPEDWGNLEPRVRPHVDHLFAQVETLAARRLIDE